MSKLHNLLLVLLLVSITIKVKAQWVRSAESKAYSRATTISSDGSANVYSSGTFACNTTFSAMSLPNNSCGEISNPAPTQTQLDAFLSKYDENGNLLWVNQYTGRPGNKVFVTDMATDVSGNSYIVGAYTDSLNFLGSNWIRNLNATTDIFVTKVLPDGNTDWVATVDVGDNSEMFAQRIAITNSNIYITGFLRGKFTIGAVTDSVGNNESFVTALDLSGNFLWTRNLYEINTNSSSFGRAITATGDSIWVYSSIADSVKIEMDTIRTPGGLAQGGVIALYNATGTLLDYQLTTSPFIEDMEVFVPDSSIYLTGRAENITAIGTDTLFYNTGIRAFVSSHDLSMSLKWSIPVSSSNTSGLTGTGISVNSDSTIVATGVFQGASVNAPSVSVNGAGGLDGYILKLDSAGIDEWIQLLGGGGEDKALGVRSIDDDHIYASGYFNEYIRVGGDEIVNHANTNNGFWARIDICPQFVAEMITIDTTFVCDRDSAIVEVTYDPAYSYQWFKDGAPLPGLDTSRIYAKDEGLYKAELTGPGCNKFTPGARLLINPLPDSVVVSSGPLDLCEGETVSLSGPFGSYTFQWFDDSTPLTGADTKDFIATTDGDYYLQVTDANNCRILSDTFNVRVYPYPLPNLTPSGRHVICSGDSVIIQADESQPGMTYVWRDGDIILPAFTSAVLVAKVEGRFSAVITNIIGCETETEADTIVVQQSPVVDLNDETAPDEICQGSSVKLVTPQVIGQTYQWIRDGGDIGGATNNSLDVFIAGDYQVRVANALCERTTDPFTISVNPLPSAAIVNNNDVAVCINDGYTLNAVTSPDFSFQWIRNGQEIIGETSSSLLVPSSGNYSVKITNEEDCFAISPVTSITVNLQPPSSIAPQGLTTFCEGQSVLLRANAGTGLVYEWFVNGVLIAGETGQDLLVSEEGNYTVEVTNSNQCSQESEGIDVDVIGYPEADIYTATGVNSICERDSLELTGGVDPTYDFQWIYNQQLLDAAGNSFYAKVPGDYQVIASIGNCRDTSQVLTLNLKPNPLPIITRNSDFLSIALFGDIQWYNNNQPLPGTNHQVIQATTNGYYKVSVTNTVGCTAWSDSLSVCLPVAEIIKVNDVLTVNTTAHTYSWNYKGIPINGATLRSLTAQQSGTYSAIVTDLNGCTMETTPVVVCIPFPFITRDPVTGVLYGFPNPASGYQWYFQNENGIYESIFDASTQVHIPDGPGQYKVEVTDLEGCISFSEPYHVPVVTATDVSSMQVSVYPNPFSEILFIERPLSYPATHVSLTTINGKVMVKEEFSGSTMHVYVGHFTPGTYLLTIGEGAWSHTYKVVKE